MSQENVGPSVPGPEGRPPGGAAPRPPRRGMMHGCLIAFLVVLGTLVLSVGLVGGMALSVPGLLAPNWTPSRVTPDANLPAVLQQRLMDQLNVGMQRAMAKGQATVEVTFTQDEMNGLLARIVQDAGGGGGGLPVSLESAELEFAPSELRLRAVARVPLLPVPILSGRRIGVSVRAVPSVVGNALQVKLVDFRLGRLGIPVGSLISLVENQMPPTGQVVLLPDQAAFAYSLRPTRLGDTPMELAIQGITVEQGKIKATLLVKKAGK